MGNKFENFAFYVFMKNPPGNFPATYVVQKYIMEENGAVLDNRFLFMSSAYDVAHGMMVITMGKSFLVPETDDPDYILGTFVAPTHYLKVVQVKKIFHDDPPGNDPTKI